MTIYLPPQAAPPSFGGRLGEAVGSGISSGLQLLAQQRMQQIQQQQKFENLQRLLGGGVSPSEIGDEDILAISQVDPNLARILQSQQKEKARATEGTITREFQRAAPFLKRMDERAELIPQKQQALSLMKDAVKTGNLGMMSWDNLAEITGIEGLRTGKGATFQIASKEFFLGSIKRAGTRPNQYIEKQIQKMLPKVGKSREANLSMTAVAESDLRVEEEFLNIANRIEQEDKAKYGYLKGDLAQRTRKAIKSFADEEMKKLEAELREIQGETKITKKVEKAEGRPIAINPATGERMVWTGKEWRKIK